MLHYINTCSFQYVTYVTTKRELQPPTIYLYIVSSEQNLTLACHRDDTPHPLATQLFEPC